MGLDYYYYLELSSLQLFYLSTFFKLTLKLFLFWGFYVSCNSSDDSDISKIGSVDREGLKYSPFAFTLIPCESLFWNLFSTHHVNKTKSYLFVSLLFQSLFYLSHCIVKVLLDFYHIYFNNYCIFFINTPLSL